LELPVFGAECYTIQVLSIYGGAMCSIRQLLGLELDRRARFIGFPHFTPLIMGDDGVEDDCDDANSFKESLSLLAI